MASPSPSSSARPTPNMVLENRTLLEAHFEELCRNYTESLELEAEEDGLWPNASVEAFLAEVGCPALNNRTQVNLAVKNDSGTRTE